MMAALDTFEYDGSYYWATLAAFLTTIFFYFYVSPTVSTQLIPSYRKFSDDKKITWNSYTVSSLFGLISSFLCAYAFLFDDGMTQNNIWYDSKVVRLSCAVVCGYMLADVVLTIKNFKQYGEIGFLAHHFVSIYAYSYIMLYGVLPYYSNFRLMAEFSTPFVNLRWLLEAVGSSKTGLPYVLNGIIMTLVFYGSRIIIMPYFWYCVWLLLLPENIKRVGHLVYVLIIASAVLDVINILWAYKMYRGVRKVLSNLFSNKNT